VLVRAQVWEEMRQQGVAPTEITYNALISACEKCGMVDRAFDVFREMEVRHLS